METSRISGYAETKKELAAVKLENRVYVVIAAPENPEEETELAFIVDRTGKRTFSVTINGYEEDEPIMISGKSSEEAIDKVLDYVNKTYHTDADTNERFEYIPGTRMWVEEYDEEPTLYNMDRYEKQKRSKEERIEKNIYKEVKSAGGEVTFSTVERIGYLYMTGLKLKNNEVYVVCKDGTECSIDEAYTIADTDLTYEDYLETIYDTI